MKYYVARVLEIQRHFRFYILSYTNCILTNSITSLKGARYDVYLKY